MAEAGTGALCGDIEPPLPTADQFERRDMHGVHDQRHASDSRRDPADDPRLAFMRVDDVGAELPIEPDQVADGVEVRNRTDRMHEGLEPHQTHVRSKTLGPDGIRARAVDQRHPMAAGCLVKTG